MVGLFGENISPNSPGYEKNFVAIYQAQVDLVFLLGHREPSVDWSIVSFLFARDGEEM